MGVGADGTQKEEGTVNIWVDGRLGGEALGLVQEVDRVRNHQRRLAGDPGLLVSPGVNVEATLDKCGTALLQKTEAVVRTAVHHGDVDELGLLLLGAVGSNRPAVDCQGKTTDAKPALGGVDRRILRQATNEKDFVEVCHVCKITLFKGEEGREEGEKQK